MLYKYPNGPRQKQGPPTLHGLSDKTDALAAAHSVSCSVQSGGKEMTATSLLSPPTQTRSQGHKAQGLQGQAGKGNAGTGSSVMSIQYYLIPLWKRRGYEELLLSGRQRKCDDPCQLTAGLRGGRPQGAVGTVRDQ